MGFCWQGCTTKVLIQDVFLAVGKSKSRNDGSQLQGGLLFKQLWTLHQSLHHRLSQKSPFFPVKCSFASKKKVMNMHMVKNNVFCWTGSAGLNFVTRCIGIHWSVSLVKSSDSSEILSILILMSWSNGLFYFKYTNANCTASGDTASRYTWLRKLNFRLSFTNIRPLLSTPRGSTFSMSFVSKGVLETAHLSFRKHHFGKILTLLNNSLLEINTLSNLLRLFNSQGNVWIFNLLHTAWGGIFFFFK